MEVIILYIQDILVLRGLQRKGIGTQLLSYVLDKYKHVRQKTLLTRTDEETALFYRRLGFIEPCEMNCVAFVRHDV